MVIMGNGGYTNQDVAPFKIEAVFQMKIMLNGSKKVKIQLKSRIQD
jgi:hypothetical protein